jgi:hypothetical protein
MGKVEDNNHEREQRRVVVKDKIEVIDENTHKVAHMAQSAAQSEAKDINNKNYKGTRFNLGTCPLGQKDRNI